MPEVTIEIPANCKRIAIKELCNTIAELLSICTGISIAACGSFEMLAYGHFSHGLRWAAAQTCLRGIAPQTPFFISRR